jgi:uncharacterized protein YjbI with pentapeptide repeats
MKHETKSLPDVEWLAALRQGAESWNLWRDENPTRSIVLDGTDLSNIDLRGANLERIDFGRADLTSSDLRRANLQRATLSSVRGLLPHQLAGTDLTGTKLPDGIATAGLANALELSKSAYSLLVVALVGCGYSLLTVATTMDARLITNSTSSALPIIGTPIPIVSFYIIAPIILFMVYLYFHLHAQRLWETLSNLPAVFPDGDTLDLKVPPWVPIDNVRSRSTRLSERRRSVLSLIQAKISALFLWWSLPVTLVLIGWRYLYRHDVAGTIFHIAIFFTSVAVAWTLSHYAQTTLNNQIGPNKAPATHSRTLMRVSAPFAVLLALFIALLVLGFKKENKDEGTGYWDYLFRRFFWASLRDTDISTRPANWTGLKEKEREDVGQVVGAALGFKNLSGADARGSFLVKADLDNAELSDAVLALADLRAADLRGASMFRVDLRLANLRGADLSYANLFEANLARADLHGAKLLQTNLDGADLQEADVTSADLQGATNLVPDQVRSARGWESALYSSDFLSKLGLPPNHNDLVLQESRSIQQR